ncbi:MAG: hypothetical protein CM15mP65_04830 [Crocinitomicaceae bacterium]|nr:MAG: hypothetical protein CM15mP65_04830 [Crocinitomicaceae bacterium]
MLEFIFTVSPVRHLKDGLVENNVSKSTLLLAVEEIISLLFPINQLTFQVMKYY